MAKRWTIPFYSQNGKYCHVDIYDRDYSGSTVTTLQGADIPFEFEENNDEDLLSVIRYRTGYIRVIELNSSDPNYIDLSGLYPKDDTSHYVEFYYDSTKMFVGYIRPEEFDDAWIAGPREINLPVTSPMGLLESKKFDAKVSPGYYTLGELLYEVITGLGYNYPLIAFPDTSNVDFKGEIHSLVISPYNSDFSQLSGTVTSLFKPVTYQDFVEGICNAFGFILHDMPEGLIFTQFAWTGSYVKYALSDLRYQTNKSSTGYNGGTMSYIDTDFKLADANATISIVNPYREITYNFQGEYPSSVPFPFERCLYNGKEHTTQAAPDTRSYVAWLKKIGNDISGSYLLDSNTLASDGALSGSKGIMITVSGGYDTINNRLIIKNNSSWSGNTELMQFTIHNHPFGECKIRMTITSGNTINALKNIDTENHYAVYMKVQVGNLWYHYIDEDHGFEWSSSQSSSIAVNTSSGDDVTLIDVPKYGAMIIHIYPATKVETPALDDGALVGIANPSIEQVSHSYNELGTEDKSTKTVSLYNVVSNKTGSVDCLFSFDERSKFNQIKTSLLAPSISYGPYFVVQQRLVAKFKHYIYPGYAAYIYKWYFWNLSYRWRIMAMSFNPRDDEWTLTLHRSSTIE